MRQLATFESQCFVFAQAKSFGQLYHINTAEGFKSFILNCDREQSNSWMMMMAMIHAKQQTETSRLRCVN